ncbi:MAG: formate/nitrite transporter family protein [Paracoccaceae bacterium]
MNDASPIRSERPRPEGRDLTEAQPLRAAHIYEIIRREGEEELERPTLGLVVSGLAAGIAIGASVFVMGMLKMRLPETEWAKLVYDLGYPVGFLIVICGRLQLFTEHTITAVTPVMLSPSLRNVARLGRLWVLIFFANMAGCVFSAWFIVGSGAFSEEAVEAILSIGRHLEHFPFEVMVMKGVGAGFLIASLVWLLPSVRSSQVLAIFLMMYVIVVCDFGHVIAGSVEVLAHVIAGETGLGWAMGNFILPALIGNIIGGTTLFTALVYSQIWREAQEEAAKGE